MGVFTGVDFYAMFNWLENVGAFDIVLPFLLVFAITFALLQKINLFGKDDNDNKGKRISAIVAVVMAFFLVSQTTLVDLIKDFLPRVSMIILVLLMLLLVVGVFVKSSEWGDNLLSIGVVVSILLVIWAIGAAAGWNVPLIDQITEQDIAVLLMVGVFVLVIWLIVRKPGNAGDDGGISKFLKGLIKKGGS